MQIQIAGLAWYKPENFLKLRSMFEDGHEFPHTYAEWLVLANNTLSTVRLRRDVEVVLVDIDPVEFARWCATRGFRLNSEARSEYCSFMAYELSRAGGPGH